MFVAAMLLGMGVFEILERRDSARKNLREPLVDREGSRQMIPQDHWVTIWGILASAVLACGPESHQFSLPFMGEREEGG